MNKVESKKQDAVPPKGGGSKAIILIVLIVVLLCAYLFYAKPMLAKFESNPITQQLMAEKELIMELNTLTQSQIAQRAVALDASEVIADPTGLMGQYVTMTGTVSEEEAEAVEANIARNYFGDSELKAYVLNDNIVVIDITGEGEDYPDGTTIRGYGVVFLLNIKDIWELPIIGPDLKQEFDVVEGMNEQAIFFITKGVEMIDVVEEAGEAENPCGDNPCAENPCGENPCGEGENPCGEAENPCTEGENPCGEEENPCGENPCGENPCGENPCG